ncbi:hypothetical protein MGSAQ_002346 [marine sediment metagenome]|uniref:Uncharacterized protein n=1 Tax=marine sediment metagenome TaxID=412755 RepID=A0A1B6NRP3_9ZZZZ
MIWALLGVTHFVVFKSSNIVFSNLLFLQPTLLFSVLL